LFDKFLALFTPVHFYLVKLCIRDTNKCTFYLYTNTVWYPCYMFRLAENGVNSKHVGET